MSKRHRSVVTVLSGGLSLSLAACAGKEAQPPPGNPPAPVEPSGATPGAEGTAPTAQKGGPSGRTPGDHPMPTANPPPPPPDPNAGQLPRWEEVASGHPEGATNPPRPLLVVMEDGPRCWKEWVGGMVPPSEEVLQVGGKVITDAAQTTGTEVVCPLRQAQSVIDKNRSRTQSEK